MSEAIDLNKTQSVLKIVNWKIILNAVILAHVGLAILYWVN